MLAAITPALLYYAALFIQVDLEARRLDIAALPADQIPSLRATLKKGWHFPIPFIVLILGLTRWNLQAEYTALLAAGILLVTRSEEHTSELQSLMRISYAVFCLKKKNKIKTTIQS